MTKRTRPAPRRHLPAAVVAIAVLGTGVATAWALSKTGGAGPQAAWGQAEDGVAPVFAAQAGPGAYPAAAGGAMGMAGPGATADAARTVAGLPGVPAIMWGAQRPHPDRGACATCHSVVKGDGRPVPQITSFSQMPHGFRGNCTNCHQITVAGGLMGRPVGGTVLSPDAAAAVTGGVPQAPAMPTPVAGAPGPNEADWRGMEVRPAPQGVMVTKAEGTAARAGVVPGDVVDSINGAKVRTIADFIGATQNGDLPQGTMIADRGGQRLAFELAKNQPAAPEVGAGMGMGMGAGMGMGGTMAAPNPTAPTPGFAAPADPGNMFAPAPSPGPMPGPGMQPQAPMPPAAPGWPGGGNF